MASCVPPLDIILFIYNIYLFLFLFAVNRFITGVIPRERVVAFERMLWRVCRGNVFLRQAEIPELIEDPATVRFYLLNILNKLLLFFRLVFQGEKVHKTVFVVFFQGEQLKNSCSKNL